MDGDIVKSFHGNNLDFLEHNEQCGHVDTALSAEAGQDTGESGRVECDVIRSPPCGFIMDNFILDSDKSITKPKLQQYSQ